MNAYEIKENRKKWIAALRSGKYEKGQGYLKRGDKYCCLGVLVEILGGEFIKDKDSEIFSIEQNAVFLPYKYRKMVGLNTIDGSFIDEYDCDCTLASLNDSTDITFSEIADLIEREPEGLFYE